MNEVQAPTLKQGLLQKSGICRFFYDVNYVCQIIRQCWWYFRHRPVKF
ncbi:hypothetical protein CJA_1739 [Cellvibrio japonicus Ueda107]|uniref:Uncharacterized protein n=1 Tax=Cellvibrio japonicus (strain Ueda107) TaxID=498211 RepID=B3PFM7_CELJU|nr:hypothetical protein CJA_1739 [Cellvibrio japonicus Ueda107]